MHNLNSVSGHLDSRYGSGATKVWYMRPRFFRDGIMGYEWLKDEGKLPQPNANLEKTHILVGEINVDHPEDAYELMQAERWSPNGEARCLVETLGLMHTSMSVGDVVQTGDAFWMVDSVGFKRIGA